MNEGLVAVLDQLPADDLATLISAALDVAPATWFTAVAAVRINFAANEAFVTALCMACVESLVVRSLTAATSGFGIGCCGQRCDNCCCDCDECCSDGHWSSPWCVPSGIIAVVNMEISAIHGLLLLPGSIPSKKSIQR